jgi:hypothetical protein
VASHDALRVLPDGDVEVHAGAHGGAADGIEDHAQDHVAAGRGHVADGGVGAVHEGQGVGHVQEPPADALVAVRIDLLLGHQSVQVHRGAGDFGFRVDVDDTHERLDVVGEVHRALGRGADGEHVGAQCRRPKAAA